MTIHGPQTAVTMHFVSEEYDRGPIFFRYPIEIKGDDTPDTLGARINAMEHKFQPYVTDLIVRKKIILDKNNNVIIPPSYKYL
ncbi:MAG: formyltransferase family protein [Candidatus Kerfeldbacteria bacterium]|jgi:phosphoribosylglycinamide formyltransferase 1